jgi:hypothetical protein
MTALLGEEQGSLSSLAACGSCYRIQKSIRRLEEPARKPPTLGLGRSFDAPRYEFHIARKMKALAETVGSVSTLQWTGRFLWGWPWRHKIRQ